MKVTFDRESAFYAELDRYAEELHLLDGDDLFDHCDLEEERANMIAATVEAFEAQLEDQDNETLFGESMWQEMCDEKIYTLVEERREALGEMSDDELQAELSGMPTIAP